MACVVLGRVQTVSVWVEVGPLRFFWVFFGQERGVRGRNVGDVCVGLAGKKRSIEICGHARPLQMA